MSDEVTKSQAAEEEGDSEVNTDILIEMMVNMAEKANIEFPVTLWVKGTVITGRVVSFETYLKELAAFFRRNTASHMNPKETFQGVFAEAIETNIDKLTGPPTDEEKDKIPPNFIHLRDARIIQGSNFIPTEGTLWRGQIKSVDGFAFGTLERR